MRVVGLKDNFKYKEWLELLLNHPEPNLDYFTFADVFNSNTYATNSHYTDLLKKLSTYQSNKLTRISTDAQSLFDVRNDLNTEFGKKYKIYWDQKNEDLNLQRRLRNQNQQTIEHLNQITNNQIIGCSQDDPIDFYIPYMNSSFLSKTNSGPCVKPQNTVLERYTLPFKTVYRSLIRLAEQTYNINDTEKDGDMTDESESESGIEVALKQSAGLAPDEVGILRVVDLSSTAALGILKSELLVDQFDSIIEATKINPVHVMSTYANEISIELGNATLSVQELRCKLYSTGFRHSFDLVTHEDAGFMEVTI